MITANEWQTLPQWEGRPDIMIITDASTSKSLGGFVICDGGLPRMASFPMHLRDIDVMEAEAVLAALKEVRHGAHIAVFTDNTAVMYGINRRHSMSPQLNDTLRRILQAADGRHLSAMYIPTDVNPADPLSRGLPLSHEHRHTIETLWCTQARMWGGGGWLADPMNMFQRSMSLV
jgi:hypothetical protein